MIHTDHQALCSLYNTKTLDQIPERLKTSSSRHCVEYIAGKDNCVSDYLSRSLVWKKSSEEGAFITDEFGIEISIEQHVNAAQTIDMYENRFKEDPLLEEIRVAGSVDDSYTAIVKALREHR